MKKAVFLVFCAYALSAVFAAELSLDPQDVRIESSAAGGYHLFVRAKPDIKSVLLTETTKDPSGKAANYAYRSPTYNPINGDEKRLLNGEFISPEKKIYSLIDSTPEADAQFGSAFHIWIPYIIEYGYEWARSGETMVLDGTFLNIRTFEKLYADYTGTFYDNPFTVRITQKSERLPVAVQPDPLPPNKPEPAAEPVPPKPDTGSYMTDTIESFSDIAKNGNGTFVFARNSNEITPLVRSILRPDSEKTLDIVFVIDATASMKNDIQSIRKQLKPMLEELLPGYRSYRIGLTLYKDYYDDFLTKTNKFTDDFKRFQKDLEAFRVMGGRDEPEAVYEGLYAALKAYEWDGDDCVIILIGDAPPHPRPRGKITRDMVLETAKAQGVQIHSIILPR